MYLYILYAPKIDQNVLTKQTNVIYIHVLCINESKLKTETYYLKTAQILTVNKQKI